MSRPRHLWRQCHRTCGGSWLAGSPKISTFAHLTAECWPPNSQRSRSLTTDQAGNGGVAPNSPTPPRWSRLRPSHDPPGRACLAQSGRPVGGGGGVRLVRSPSAESQLRLAPVRAAAAGGLAEDGLEVGVTLSGLACAVLGPLLDGGAQLAQDTGWPGVGNLVMSRPISTMIPARWRG